MDVEELNLVTSVIDKKLEVWIEDEYGRKHEISDYDYDLKNNRIILKVLS